jgi:hypothetical protein
MKRARSHSSLTRACQCISRGLYLSHAGI